ncbi:MFS transporter [Paenibacillus wulumuqiensis]|uniref:MFS transporter n=1 Tax=Paenibacillus wulumuqiensis TaxID=1567107 RepID=UPI0009E25AEB|nr:MFS transporter [Paenibacillus wulumuqiensis]
MKSLFSNLNFLSLFTGRMVTNIGDSIYYVASMWLVYQLSGSTFYTGLAGFLILLPKTLQFLTGPLVDRWNVKKTLITTQLLQAVLILIIPAAYMLDLLSVQLILIVMPLLAIIAEFAYPVQTKMLPLVLTKDQLVKGNSLMAFAYQGIDLVFNALAGVMVNLVGAIALYWMDSVTFIAAAICFAMLKLYQPGLLQKEPAAVAASYSFKIYISDLQKGFSIVFHSLLRFFLIGLVVANFAIGCSMAVLPAFADYIGGAESYGLLLAAMSAGSLIGALAGASCSKYRMGKLIIVCFTIGAVCWTISAMVTLPAVSIVLFGIAWIFIGMVNVMFAGIFQSVIPNHLLGRVNSVMTSISVIAMPIGSLLGGYFATRMQPSLLLAAAGGGIFFIAVVWLLHPRLRQLPAVTQIDRSILSLNIPEEKEDVELSKPINPQCKTIG